LFQWSISSYRPTRATPRWCCGSRRSSPRFTTLITNAWFDAIAPYHPTAVGVYSRIGRRPPQEATDYNRNVAILYASYHVLNSLLPKHTAQWQAMLTGVGLNPNNSSMQVSSPIGDLAYQLSKPHRRDGELKVRD
jgi:hypothetical protein